MNIKIRKLHEDATIPQYATEGAAGFDLVAIEDTILEPGETALIRTGLAFEIPQGYEMQVRPRSGITLKTKLRVQLGTVDADYRGEVGVIVDNIAHESGADYIAETLDGDIDVSCSYDTRQPAYKIRAGDRIAQAVITPIVRANFIEADELTETRRAADGFGSTGIATEQGAENSRHIFGVLPSTAEAMEVFSNGGRGA